MQCCFAADYGRVSTSQMDSFPRDERAYDRIEYASLTEEMFGELCSELEGFHIGTKRQIVGSEKPSEAQKAAPVQTRREKEKDVPRLFPSPTGKRGIGEALFSAFVFVTSAAMPDDTARTWWRHITTGMSWWRS